MPVVICKEDVSFRLTNRARLLAVIKLIGLVEQREIGCITIIFVSDERLLEINRRFLFHDFYTDIVTFQYLTPPSIISGDLFISIDRVQENAVLMNMAFFEEIARVVIHGVLHLCGYKDKKAADKKLMRKKEDFYLKSMATL
jgi:rRNA maturation RNase YbeY